jgi:DNA processing protein
MGQDIDTTGMLEGVSWSRDTWIRLAHLGRLPLAAVTRLAQCWPSDETLARASRAALTDAGIPAAAAERWRSISADDIRACVEWLRGPDRHLVDLGSAAYPPLLRRISDPPVALYVCGDRDALSLPMLAMVGSRNPTRGGQDNARQFAAHLAGCGLIIVSGLAAGVDSASHLGALDADGLTVAVCGTGLDTIYPASNTSLAQQIARNGALLSEYPIGTPPRRANFPQRNRLISGMALGTLIVEASRRSGSLITARLASEQGREVFAIPGSIHNPMARGCHWLIRQGAKLVETAEDVLEELAPLLGAALGQPRARTVSPSQPVPALDADYLQLLDAMGHDPASIDTLVERSGLTAAEVSSMLLILELNGLVVAAPGGLFTRTPSKRLTR